MGAVARRDRACGAAPRRGASAVADSAGSGQSGRARATGVAGPWGGVPPGAVDPCCVHALRSSAARNLQRR